MYGILLRGELGAEGGAGWRCFTPEAQTTERRSGALLQRSERGSAAAPMQARFSSAEKRGGSGAGAALFCGEARRLRCRHGSFLRRSAAARIQARLSSAEKRGGSDADTALFCGEARRLGCRRGSLLRRSAAAPARARLFLRRSAAAPAWARLFFCGALGAKSAAAGVCPCGALRLGGYSVMVSPAGRETRWLFQTASPPSRLARTVSLPSFREISTCPSGRGSVPSKESAADASGATTKVA